MKTDQPALAQVPQLRLLWKEAFGDPDWFLDAFFAAAFSPGRCRCITAGDQIAAALYWFDCGLGKQKIAYIYAVATAKAHRGKGLCHRLMADTHALLARSGYSGALLVPQQESLRQFYHGMGYRNAGGMEDFFCTAGKEPVPLRAIGREEFALRRRRMLPPGSVLQEGENLVFLESQLQFYTGAGFLLAAWEDKGILHGTEYLGNREMAPGILRALNCREGVFRIPGEKAPFAMFLPLTENAEIPAYFGFAFD